MPWRCVDLAGKPWHPKTMNDVHTRCGDFYGHANGNVQRVYRRGRTLAIEIDKLPVPHPRACLDPYRIARAVADQEQTFTLRKRIRKQEDKHRNGESQTSTDDPGALTESAAKSWPKHRQHK